ncbi:MAG: NAD-glutamate dehydrogenase [Novosphingobium sp.]
MSKGTGGNGVVKTIAGRLAASLLPGDPPFAKSELEEAARFVATAARQRKSGAPSIAIESVSGRTGKRYMRIALINRDMPFLVDSVAAAIDAEGIVIDRLVHPVLQVKRDSKGALKDVAGNGAMGTSRESAIYVETRRADARTRRSLEEILRKTLAQVYAAVEDWPAMQAAIAEDAERCADAEGAALLRWLHDGMLTQLGHVVRRRDGSNHGAIGICRNGGQELLAAKSYDTAFAWFEDAKAQERFCPGLLIIKANHVACVHRRVPLDLFIVPLYEKGRLAALSVHAGVWTSAALATPPDRVPLLRARLAAMMQHLGFDPSGHAGKTLVHVLTALPHDLLIGFAAPDLQRIATSMMSLIDRPRPKLSLVLSPLKRHLFAFVWLPRDAISTQMREQITAMLCDAAEAPLLDWSLEVEGNNLALLRFVLDIRNGEDGPAEAPLDARLHDMVRGWDEAVEIELARYDDPARAAVIASRFADAFPLAYRNAYGAGEAAIDIQRLRLLPPPANGSARRGARLHCLACDSNGQLRLKLYQRGGESALSETVPVLENFGFRVIEDIPTGLDAGAGRVASIHDFVLVPPQGEDCAALLARAAAIEAAIEAVLNGEAENDAFNRLIIANALSAREVVWLRAWYRYLRQAGLSFTIQTAVDALQGAPGVARGLIGLFLARHDPAFKGNRDKIEAEARNAIRDGLAMVTAINDDRLLRQYHALVEAILRTNAFAPASDTALSFKLDSAMVPGLPRPVPWREIFVYSRRVEGIHLRAGPVARGGLRWSDRRDDFRTEVLGLMKAQRVKNAVIVPTGAKGGFYPKRLPDPRADRDAWAAEGKASYQLFVRSLLSLTDNIVNGKVVHPANMVIRDGDDPYFVVAADKGTATFSDTANALAAERDFWLDDAFASGGSNGYDHKAMGITARGAWLSVQRHFREMGIDVQSEPVRVAGCGDMSGDVFGNGMLLSQSIKLVAAFDHRHIFIDPNPDPAKSWAERKRLFELPRSSWDEYDRKLMSKGGGIYPRSLKEVKLSKEARAVLGIDTESIDPDGLISAILRSSVDLLWFGGIGTYVKSSAENNIQVGDPGNDALRVNGGDIRARVIGEGANLGCTQAGRIEFALAGGRINTDFIDNSAGVDCSDKEVNIKIALAMAKREGRLTEPARVKLLTAMTDDVAELVLEDNRLQALALSIAQSGGASGAGSFVRLSEALEESGQLDRKTEGIADGETLRRRAADGQGLTRPELAVLISNAKLALQDALEESRLPDDPGLEPELLAAFPPAMRRKFGADLRSHRLRREVIATRIANRLINRIGPIHLFELVEEEGAGLAQVAGAFVAAEGLLGMDRLWDRLETAQMPEEARVLALRRSASGLRLHMADLLRSGADMARPAEASALFEPGVRELSASAHRLLGAEARNLSDKLRSELTGSGVPSREADMVAHLADMDGAIGLAKLAGESGINTGLLTQAFSAIGAELGIDWAQGAAAQLRPSDPWERLLVSGLARDFQQMRLDFLRRVTGRKSDPVAAVGKWTGARQDAVRQFRAMIGRAKNAVPVTPSVLAQIAGQARTLLGR